MVNDRVDDLELIVQPYLEFYVRKIVVLRRVAFKMRSVTLRIWKQWELERV